MVDSFSAFSGIEFGVERDRRTGLGVCSEARKASPVFEKREARERWVGEVKTTNIERKILKCEY